MTLKGEVYDCSNGRAPPAANTLAGGSVAQPGVKAERWGVEASNCGSAIGEEGSEPSTLIFDMPGLMFDDGRGLALRIRVAMRSLFLAMAMADRLNASMSSSIVACSSGGS